VCDIVVKKFTFAISSFDEFLLRYASRQTDRHKGKQTDICRHADSGVFRREASRHPLLKIKNKKYVYFCFCAWSHSASFFIKINRKCCKKVFYLRLIYNEILHIMFKILSLCYCLLLL